MSSLLRPLRLFLAVNVGLTVLTWLVAVAARHRHWPYPLDTPLAPPGSTFYDFFDYVGRFPFLHTARFFSAAGYPFTYFAPGIVVYRLLYLPSPRTGLHLYLAVVVLFTISGGVLLARRLHRLGLRPAHAALVCTLSLLASYPIGFCIERGNPEILLAIGIALGLWAFCTGHRLAAALLWGIFGSVKLYPLLFAALFLARREVRLFLVTLVTTLVTNLLCLWYAGPSISVAFRGIQRGTHAFISIYSLTEASNEWDHSLFSVPKRLLFPLGVNHRLLLALYFVLAGSLMLLFWVRRLRHLPVANQIVVYSVAMVLLPPTSFDYTLVQLYGAWAVLVLLAVRSGPAAPPLPGLTLALGLLALLFSPGNLLTIAGLNLNGQSKALLLLALLLVAARHPFVLEQDSHLAQAPVAAPRARPSFTLRGALRAAFCPGTAANLSYLPQLTRTSPHRRQHTWPQ